jgi:hypothetical protein
MSNKLFTLAMTGLLTASGTAVLSALSIVSTPLTPSANAQVQAQKLQPAVSVICKSGAAITPNCVPKNGDFRQMPPGYSVNPRGVITIPRHGLPQPEPKPSNGVITIPRHGLPQP